MTNNRFVNRPCQLFVFGTLAFIGSLAGCSKPQEPWEKVVPVTGVVKYQGKAVAGAVVTLIPQNSKFPKSVRPTAITEDDGTFEVGTYSQADGAPAGTYKVLIVHFTVVGDADNPIPGPNDLPEKYSKIEETDIKVTIDDEETELKPFELN